MKKYVWMFLSLALILSLSSCNFLNNETNEAFQQIATESDSSSLELTKKTEELQQMITDSAMANPEKYAIAFNHMKEFHSKSERLLSEMQRLRELIEEQVGETGDYEKWDENTDAIFFNGDAYSENGALFVKAIEDYNTSISEQLFFFPEAEKLAASSFNIDNGLNRDGEEIDWFTYNFKGFPAVATKAKIAIMEEDVKEVEVTFLKALIEKPQF